MCLHASEELFSYFVVIYNLEQIEESDTTSSEEKKCDTPEESDSTENLKSSTQLYTCFVNPINNGKYLTKSAYFINDGDKIFSGNYSSNNTYNE